MELREFMPSYGNSPKTPDLSEKEFQKQFIHSLRERDWIVFEEERDITKQHRIDAIITRKDVGYFIGIEFKVPDHFDEITKALRQIIEYRNDKFTYPPSLHVIITPHRLTEESIRYFWRWGFGVSNYDPYKEIIFVNGEIKNIINLDKPENVKPWHQNTPEKVADIIQRMEKYR